jgi:hypothetical protein
MTINFEDSFSKSLRRFLGQIVPDAALDKPVRIFTREMWRLSIRIPGSNISTGRVSAPGSHKYYVERRIYSSLFSRGCPRFHSSMILLPSRPALLSQP